MIKGIWLCFLLFISLVFQSTLLENLAVVGVKPDLLLVIVIIYALLYGKKEGLKVGFFYGLIEDLVTGRFIGLNCVSKMATGYIIGLGEGKFFRDNMLVSIIALLIGSLLNCIFIFILGFFSGFPGIFPLQQFLEVVIFLTIYNVCLAPFVYGFYYKFAGSSGKKRLEG